MPTIDQQFVEYIVKALVENEGDVDVDRIVDEKGVLLTLTVNPEDLGRVIGRRGVTAQSLRTLLRALGTKNSARYNLKIVNNDSPEDGEERQERVSGPTSEQVSEDAVDSSTDESVENAPSRTSSFARKSREELAELDDLDI
ncbi:MAG: KH domain-containing protein [Candidatus Saccharimonas sp.]